MGELQNGVHSSHFVGVDVGVHHGYLIVQLAAFNLGDDLLRLGLRTLAQLQPVLHGGAVLGHDQVGHVIAGGGLAHDLLFHIGLGRVGVVITHRGQFIQLVIDLPHGVERLVGLDLHGDVLAQIHVLAVHRGGQLKGTADVKVKTAVGMGDAFVAAAGYGLGGERQRHGFLAAVKDSLQAGHLEGIVSVSRSGALQIFQVDFAGFVGIHLALTVERNEFSVCRVGVSGGTLQGPSDVLTLCPAERFFIQREGQADLSPFRQRDYYFLGLFGDLFRLCGKGTACQQHGSCQERGYDPFDGFYFHVHFPFLSVIKEQTLLRQESLFCSSLTRLFSGFPATWIECIGNRGASQCA